MHELPAMHVERSATAWAMPLVLALGAIAYVYRLPLGFGNVSVFRAAGFLSLVLVSVRMMVSPICEVHSLARRMFLPVYLSGAITLVAASEIAFGSMPAGYEGDVLVQTMNLVIFLFFVAYIHDQETIRRVVHAYIVVSFVEAIVAIDSYLTGSLMFGGWVAERGAEYYSDLALVNEAGGLRRLTGTFYDPNFYGIYLCSVVAVSAWALLHMRRSRFALLAVPLSIGLIFLTASRTAMLGLIAVGFTLFWFEARARRFVIRSAFVVLPLMAVISYVFSEMPLLERVLSGESVGDRMAFFARGIDAFMLAPVFGSGTHALIDPDSGYATAHMLYLTVLGKFGLVGAVAYAAFIFSPLLVRPGKVSRANRSLAALCILPMAAMYLGYDYFQFLELQYLVFAIAYAAVTVEHGTRRIANTP